MTLSCTPCPNTPRCKRAWPTSGPNTRKRLTTTKKRQFAEFLQGQKEFPQNILLKRQRDLQAAMERSLAFRHEADSLLSQAAIDLEAPIRQRLNAAIQAVGLERGYAGIVNLDTPSMPFVNPRLTEDATPYVVEKLILTRDR